VTSDLIRATVTLFALRTTLTPSATQLIDAAEKLIALELYSRRVIFVIARSFVWSTVFGFTSLLKSGKSKHQRFFRGADDAVNSSVGSAEPNRRYRPFRRPV
jgi:hypothetical protein